MFPTISTFATVYLTAILE